MPKVKKPGVVSNQLVHIAPAIESKDDDRKDRDSMHEEDVEDIDEIDTTPSGGAEEIDAADAAEGKSVVQLHVDPIQGDQQPSPSVAPADERKEGEPIEGSKSPAAAVGDPPREGNFLIPRHQHELSYFSNRYEGRGWICDICFIVSNGGSNSYSCDRCGWDVHPACFRRAGGVDPAHPAAAGGELVLNPMEVQDAIPPVRPRPPSPRRPLEIPWWMKMSTQRLFFVQAFIGIIALLLWIVEASNLGHYAAINARQTIVNNCRGTLEITCRLASCEKNCDDTGQFCDHYDCWLKDTLNGTCSVGTSGVGISTTQTGLIDVTCQAEWYENRTQPIGCSELCAGQKKLVREYAAVWLVYRAVDIIHYFIPYQMSWMGMPYAIFISVHDIWTLSPFSTPMKNLYAIEIAAWCCWGVSLIPPFVASIMCCRRDRDRRMTQLVIEFGRWGLKLVMIAVCAWQLNISESGRLKSIENAYDMRWGYLGVNLVCCHILAGLWFIHGFLSLLSACCRTEKENEYTPWWF